MKNQTKDHIMLTGMEFRAIRKFSRITQEVISSYLGYNNTETIRQIERQELVPERFCKLLSMLSDYDLADREKVNELLERIPQKYKEINYHRRITRWDAFNKIRQFIFKKQQQNLEQNQPKSFVFSVNNIEYEYDVEKDEVTILSPEEEDQDANS